MSYPKLYESYNALCSIVSGSHTTDVQGSPVSTNEFTSDMAVMTIVNGITTLDESNYFTQKIEFSTDGENFTDQKDHEVVPYGYSPRLISVGSNRAYVSGVNVRPGANFIRVSMKSTGSPSASFSSYIVGQARVRPCYTLPEPGIEKSEY